MARSKQPTALLSAIAALLRDYDASLIGVQILRGKEITNRRTPPIQLTFGPIGEDSRVTVVSLAIEEPYAEK